MRSTSTTVPAVIIMEKIVIQARRKGVPAHWVSFT